MSAIVAGKTGAEIATIKSQQFEKGRYPVRGATDNKLYSASFVGRPKTGVYNEPSLGLFSEKKKEAVIDGLTTEKLLWNYPHIWNGITTLAAGGTPQFADGRYPTAPGNTSSTAQPVTVIQQSDPELKAFLQHLISNGVRSNINTQEVFSKQQQDEANIRASEL